MKNTNYFLTILIVFLTLILLYTLSTQNYAGAMTTVFMLILLICFLIMNNVIPLEQQNSKIFGLIFIVSLISSGFIAFKINNAVINYVFKHKAQQQFCGVIQSEYSEQVSRGSIYFWKIENPKSKQTFDFRKYDDDELKIGQQICVTYAIDKRWKNTPYIYAIIKESYH